MTQRAFGVDGISASYDDFLADWRAWRDARLAELREPYGMLAPIGLYWLTGEWQEFPALPGRWRLSGKQVEVDASGNDELILASGDRRTTIRFDPARTPAVRYRDIVISVSEFPAGAGQPVQYAVRPLDPRSPLLTNFRPVPTYRPDPKWVTLARYERYDIPLPVTLDTVVAGVRKDLALFGCARFALAGAECTLEVYSAPRGELHIPFRDATNGATTYPVRVVAARLPTSRSAEFILDFNRATNGPCGLTPYATCALPPAGNTLPFAVEAGEKVPEWRTDLDFA
ncbi:DUF1684 domain-containing protein [Kribbella kalugense]|uniref:DUF1684 domain-containing protein n=1 Tax=Kribbella kalugense TaxID=2512221 RepID=A0A4R8A404_9ACTN|nr:DUF1684 domain-containing protein [Kribbella kalugense]TDW24188.1 hypothetical protein EV650_3056 [Kribbella kalugense]